MEKFNNKIKCIQGNIIYLYDNKLLENVEFIEFVRKYKYGVVKSLFN